MSDRPAQIVALLGELNEGLPEPTRRDHSTSGFVNEPRERTCPDCLANGRVMVGCATCGGSGVVSPARIDGIALVDALPDDGQVRDPYAVSETVQAYGVRDTRKFGHVPERDAAIDRARKLAQDRPPSELDAAKLAEPYLWERDRAARRRQYDFAPLEAALELLRDRAPGICSLIFSVYVYRELSESSATVEKGLAIGIAFIDERMPDPIRAPGLKHPALARRDRRAA